MNRPSSIQQVEQELSDSQTHSIIKSIGIPARPMTLVKLQQEVQSDDPDLHKIAELVVSDVTISVAVLRTVNSSAFSLSRKCETVEQAVALVGFKRLENLVTTLVLRNLVKGDPQKLTYFWDISAKRSYVMSRLARGLGVIDEDIAQSFGLFCDVGIPLLMQRFPEYERTLVLCNSETERTFTEVEQSIHQTDHALVGAIMARSWELSTTLCLSIRLHHDYAMLEDTRTPEAVTKLVAMNLIAEAAIQRFHFMKSVEWMKGGKAAAFALSLSDYEVEDWIDRLSYDLTSWSV
ncbi:HDOD domain-containing protein [Candidatus Symbiobacter mobilis]|uniref:Signal transduction protein n=1 Tax=Candidatus Symbiobacter mobilis CR TaxID=946483 RepID=U5N8D4_9BURK|nr:HDOD domain-containing protein [Candidatus Symbiobacter mobilis]AGX86523.1 signal transduction protein [Candidatus Symbiobacter mobilis CR]